MIFGTILVVWPKEPEGHKELGQKEDDLDSAEDGDSGEESHCAPYQAQGCLNCHLLCLFHLVKGCRTEMYVHRLDMV